LSEQIDKAFVSFRISTGQWEEDKQFEKLIELFENNKGLTDEITFFLSITHSPATLEYVKEHCNILTKRMDSCRKLGYKTGINILCTTGHHEENLDNMFKGDYYHLTNIDGDICRGAYCPNSEKYRKEYVKPLYEFMSQAKPDYIWIDDDVRLAGHLPIRETCFCDNCMEIFSQKNEKKYSRQSLEKEFNCSDEKIKLKIRKAWLRHNSRTIGSILKFIEQTVHNVNPNISLGFMDGSRFMEGLDMKLWANSLKCDQRDDVMWRPGGGNYTEENLWAIINKTHVVAMEAAMLPKSVKIIESEIESFPYKRLDKSAHYTALEANLYTVAGCTGTAFNVLPMYGPLDDYLPLAKKLHDNRPFLDLLAKSFGRSNRKGLFTGLSKDSYAAMNFSGDWLKGTETAPPAWIYNTEISNAGLPTAYTFEDAAAIILSKDNIRVFDDEQIRKILSGGVYMDGDALKAINEMGYADFTGFKIKTIRKQDTVEKCTNHKLNKGSEDFIRDGRQSFWPSLAYILEPKANAEILSFPMDYTYKQIDECCSGVFENSLGGRICVMGYYPWDHLLYSQKMKQLKNVFNWLSKNTITSYVESYHKINMWDSIVNDKHVTALTNTYFDLAENVELMLKSKSNKFEVTDMSYNSSTINAVQAEKEYKKIIIPQIEPWNMVLVKEL
jgi:hypothetical protein